MKMTATRGVVFWMVMLLGALTKGGSSISSWADSPVQATIVVPPPNTHGIWIETTAVIASGAMEDMLTDCMARIPEGASAGQRMLDDVVLPISMLMPRPLMNQPSVLYLLSLPWDLIAGTHLLSERERASRDSGQCLRLR
jgi:hypothetical protein